MVGGALLLVPEDDRPDDVGGPRARSPSCCFFVGFHLTFLIQHSAGLDGMPRRIYEYSEASGWQRHEPDLDDRRVRARAQRAADGHQRRPLAQEGRRSPGPDPWKANTLEWFTPSPPPENNFDVVPRVRSVEPMKDIRRQIERQTGVPQRFEAGKPMVQRVDGSLARHHRRRACELGGVRQVVADYVTLTKPRVQLLLLLTTVTTMYVAGDPSLSLVAAHAARRLAVGGRRRRGQPLLRPRHRRPDGAHGHAAGAVGPRLAAARRWSSASCCRRCRSCCWPTTVNVLAAFLALAGLPRLRVRLHDLAQAHDAAEHRDRRRRRRRAAAGRLGGGHRRRSTRPPCTCSRSSSTGRRRTSGRCRC